MPGPLISPAALAAALGNATVVIDCRWYLGEPDAGASAYAEGHIPGAVYASLDTDLAGSEGPGRHPLPSPEAFAATIERLGVSPRRSVVVYDDRGGAVASRLWWMLTQQGHTSTYVLDGGLQAWTEAGLPTTTDVAIPQPGQFHAAAWTGIVEREAVAERAPDVHVIDARSRERYVGDDEPVDPKAGHIPGALSMPLTDNLDEDLRFLPSASLRTRFVAAGVEDGTDVISQCGSGVTACHNILAMEIAGFGRPLLYVGSWSDWSTEGMPVATGTAP